jgi:adenosylmethionine-8-amino-7-oxononanoate aminotransferase
MIIYPEAYLEKITSFAKEYNILVIFDEVATGFGRTGSMFAMNKINNLPDIAVFSKALTGGWLPLSVTASTDEIFDAFYDDDRTKTLFHGHSYTGNPISCSAAVKALEIYKRDNFPQSNEKAMFFFHSKLKALSDYDFISDIRYLGWIGAVDLKDKKGKALESETMSKIYSESLKNGVILRPLGNTIYWWLPINTTEDQIDEIIKISISTVTSVLK